MTIITPQPLQPTALDSTAVTPLVDNKIEAYEDGIFIDT